MKHFILFLTAIFLSASLIAQGNGQGKGKDKQKDNGKSKTAKNKIDNTDKRSHEDIIWDGTKYKNTGGPKLSKNQPAKVRAAFQRDYPNAINVRWSKYRGDWTATFGNGIFTSTAVYHANGDRRDTRTPIRRNELPVKIEDIFKKRPQTRLEDIIKIEVPQRVKDIFRIKTIADGVSKFLFYDTDGSEVQYNY